MAEQKKPDLVLTADGDLVPADSIPDPPRVELATFPKPVPKRGPPPPPPKDLDDDEDDEEWHGERTSEQRSALRGASQVAAAGDVTEPGDVHISHAPPPLTDDLSLPPPAPMHTMSAVEALIQAEKQREMMENIASIEGDEDISGDLAESASSEISEDIEEEISEDIDLEETPSEPPPASRTPSQDLPRDVPVIKGTMINPPPEDPPRRGPPRVLTNRVIKERNRGR